MRLALAIAVLLVHSHRVAYGVYHPDPVWDGPARPFARLVLPMFFALSGFLVAGSMERAATLPTFLGLRVIRIYPALAVEVFLSAFLIGPLVTTLPLETYLTDPLFRTYLLNATGHISFYLPGVFTDNPRPGVVNSQLWTVPIELGCYVIAAILWLLGAKRDRRIVPVIGSLLTFAWFVYLLATNRGYALHNRPATGPMLTECFLLGATLYAYRAHVPRSAGWLAVSAILALALLSALPTAYLAPPFIAYMTVYIGLSNPQRLSIIRGADYSYGIFLYGFVIQQLIIHALPSTNEWYWNFLFALPLSAAVAALSWHFVERPALRLKRLFGALSGNRSANPSAPR